MENKVANKAIETIDLLKLIDIDKLIGLDIKSFLFQEFLLKEKDFRLVLKSFNFKAYQGKLVYIFCSNDAIVPMWAYMLISSYFSELSINHIFAHNKEEAINRFVENAIDHLDMKMYEAQRVIVKGCGGKISLGALAYIKITEKLKPVAKAISYGEACSMVPISKKG